MPRVNIGKPPFQQELEASLRSLYGGSMKASEVGREIGLTRYSEIYSFLSDTPVLMIGERKRWRVEDVAALITKARCEA